MVSIASRVTKHFTHGATRPWPLSHLLSEYLVFMTAFGKHRIHLEHTEGRGLGSDPLNHLPVCKQHLHRQLHWNEVVAKG